MFCVGDEATKQEKILFLKKINNSPVNFLVLLRKLETGVKDISKRITPVLNKRPGGSLAQAYISREHEPLVITESVGSRFPPLCCSN